MYIVSKKINEKEYIIYLMSETGQKIKARIVKADLEDKLWE